MLAPFMIAVSGGSGSGKTTFVNKLKKQLADQNPLVVSIDHYYKDLGHLAVEDRAQCNFDDPESIEKSLLYEQISQLREGRSVSRPSYDFATHTRTELTETLEPSPLIIMDGIFSLCYPELLQLFDLKVYIDVEDDIRVVRRIKRDMAERGRSFDSCANQYLGTVRDMHRKHIEPTKNSADLVVPWHKMNERAVVYLADLIHKSIAERASR